MFDPTWTATHGPRRQQSLPNARSVQTAMGEEQGQGRNKGTFYLSRMEPPKFGRFGFFAFLVTEELTRGRDCCWLPASIAEWSSTANMSRCHDTGI